MEKWSAICPGTLYSEVHYSGFKSLCTIFGKLMVHHRFTVPPVADHRSKNKIKNFRKFVVPPEIFLDFESLDIFEIREECISQAHPLMAYNLYDISRGKSRIELNKSLSWFFRRSV